MLKFQSVSLLFLTVFAFICLIIPSARAAQLAIVQAERAIIYADERMSSPLGYIRKGKKVKVGNVARNKAQVYPISISGRTGWIRVVDVTTERESAGSDRLTAERFSKTSNYRDYNRTRYSVSLLQYLTRITLDKENGTIRNGDALNWTGVSLRGDAWVSRSWDLQVVMNYMSTKKGDENFKIFEIGGGAGYKFYQDADFLIRLDGVGTIIPFSTYELGSLFRKRGFGFSLGGLVNVNYKLARNWGLEGYGGLFYSKVGPFDAPVPYKAFNASFVGARIGLGVTFQM